MVVAALMDSGLLVLLFVFIGVPVIAFGLIHLANRFYRARRRAVLEKEMPAEWLEIIERNLPVFRRLPFELKRQLETNLKLFLAKTRFEGYGLEIDEEIRVTIAAQACLLALGRPGKQLYPNLRTVIVYPTSFKAGKKGVFGTDLDATTLRLGDS